MVDDPIYGDDYEIEADVAEDVLLPDLAIRDKAPMFQVLFQEAVDGDPVLEAFAEHVVGRLSDQFATKAAKGGAFFVAREAEGMSNTARFQHDQNLRAHLINGILPVIHIVRQLIAWDAPMFEHWTPEEYERLLIAGYMLHDFTKIAAVKQRLKEEGFKEYDAPDEAQMPLLREIFATWCANLGLDAFLEPVGGVHPYLNDLIYIAVNTQALKGTARNLRLYGRLALDIDRLDQITYLSRMADLMAYVAKTPREVVAHESIRKLMVMQFAFDEGNKPVARLIYHHVAENRGLLLNFIHNGVMQSLTNEWRVPLLFAPGGVVYLEHRDAPPVPDVDTLVDAVVDYTRTQAGEKLISSGKGAKRGNTFMQIDDSYNDFFSMSEMIVNSMKLISRYIRSNKTPSRFQKMTEYQWTGWDNIPENYPQDSKDARADQIAEWAGFVETQFRDRFNPDTTDIIRWLLEKFGISDLEDDFLVLKSEATRGGLRYWWHWAAAHALNRQQPPLDDLAVEQWLHRLSQELIDELPDDMPDSARVNQETWRDIADYIRKVLTIGGTKSQVRFAGDELEQYVQAKVKRGVSACAICGLDYPTRRPAETAVAFQPGVYTQRISIGASNNKRNLCSICATEQLLRQLFLQNLDTGSRAEAQRIRYLSFYPSYFFSPQTIRVIQRAYRSIRAIRMSDADFGRVLRSQDNLRDPSFWQRLDSFLLRPAAEEDTARFKKVLRYDDTAQSTFFTAGFRNIDPTETESWVLPVFLSLVMAINLDVKVVASDSGVPLMHEATELPETLWFDGAHPAIQQLIAVRHVPEEGDKEAHDKLEIRSRLDVDSLLLALARLTAAYLIHLDTEYEPPKENWQRFVPIANALCESPLYVFHYLKKQERESENKPITRTRIQRYLHYTDLFNLQGDQGMTHASKLVDLYRGFYRARSMKNANSILRPLSVVSDALLVADQKLFSDTEALIEVAHGEIYRFMDRVGSGQADGRFPKGISAEERRAHMREFARYFVIEVFEGAFNCDVAALRGKQLNLLKSACEVLYREAQHQEWAESGDDADDESDES